MTQLDNVVALVTGATRGVGKGVALALAELGATVYVTGRTREGQPSPALPGTLEATVAELEARGGRGIAVACDHAQDEQVREAFARVQREQGRLDILVNNVFAIPSDKFWEQPFWEQPIENWDLMHGVGLRSHYLASQLGVPLLLQSERGLIVNISSFGGLGYQLSVAYGVGKAGVDRLTRDMAKELKPHGVACLALYPGIVRTERILKHGDELPFDTAGETESPEFTGRAVAALYTDPKLFERTGRVWVVAELAEQLGFEDVDGSRPAPLARLNPR